MRNLLWAVFISSVTLLYSCNKIPNDPVAADLKAAFSFQPGTYWIYKDSISGQIDSFYVTSNNPIHSSSYTTSGKTPSSTYDQIHVQFAEYNINNYNNTTPTTWDFYLQQNTLSIVHNYDGTGDGYGSMPFPFVNNEKLGDPHDTLFLLNSYFLNGSNFIDVAKAHFIYYSMNDFLYVVPGIGLIKMQLSHFNKIWELQRWNIVK